ncbi:unnamed protein product [Taenia asiatica]|uniref:Arginine-hydroxylase NDUFAF5, mitochondrial n=1 Tax=Taenia asiatica TaxID=60517 RepID=A0A0R3W6A0_TAEAS|nr:unnamed protein product [Taenia asiatica]
MLRVSRSLLFTSLRHSQRYQVRFSYASSLPVFDRKSKKIQRARASLRLEPSLYDYLRDEAAFRLADRVCDITRVFDIAAEIGCGRGHLIQNLTSDSVKFLYQCDNSFEILKQVNPSPDVETLLLKVDEECLPFAENSFNMVLSSLSLHWINDLPSTLSQVLDRLLTTLRFYERLNQTDVFWELLSLRTHFLSYEFPFRWRKLNGLVAFILTLAPLSKVLDSVNFFANADSPSSPWYCAIFTQALLFVSQDVDDVEVLYPSMFELIDDLRGMGESNAVISRPLRLNRDVLFAASSIYDGQFGTQRGDEAERCIPATFRFLFFIAWKPDPSQAKPLPRGSGEFSLRDIGRLDELSTELEKKNARKPE